MFINYVCIGWLVGICMCSIKVTMKSKWTILISYEILKYLL